jgi:hypothetical protein
MKIHQSPSSYFIYTAVRHLKRFTLLQPQQLGRIAASYENLPFSEAFEQQFLSPVVKLAHNIVEQDYRAFVRDFFEYVRLG